MLVLHVVHEAMLHWPFLKSNGVKSPVAVISAADTGINGVPCEIFFNNAHSYLVLDQS